MAVSQPGFLTLKPSINPTDLVSGKRKRVNKNKKRNWNKHSDITDVEAFLEDVRHQERTTGGLLSETPDDGLFFLDIGAPKKIEEAPEPEEGKKRKGKASRPLRIDLILQPDSRIPAPKNVLAYQQPNAKKLRRSAQKAAQLAAGGALPRKQRLLLNRRPQQRKTKRAVTEANNNPDRDYYDIWGQETKETADPWYLQQTKKKRVQRPERLNAKPSVLPAVEVIAPGGSYNPDFFAHQALLQDAHDIEVVKQKQEDKIERQLAYNKEDTATEETVFQEQVQGLVEDSDEDLASDRDDDEEEEEDEDVAVGGIAVAQKKTERQRKREKAEKIKEQQRLSERDQVEKRQQIFQLRSISASIKKQDQETKNKQIQRKEKQEAQKSQPRRLGRLKFQPQDMEVQLSDELAGSLRCLKPEGSVLKDRFKSLQKRNLIEPRERAKFKRRLKVKYVEKRAFREIS